MRFISPSEFQTIGELSKGAHIPFAVRTSGLISNDPALPARTIRYIFSDATVARDNHIIKAGAWDLANFLKNPVFLWAHDQGEPPIGKVTEIAERDGLLVGAVEYLDRDVSAFADSIYQMAKGGFLNATSASWLPVEWKYAADKSRPGGVDFSRVELLEISQVPVPALPSALATARAAGLDTAPIFEWATRMLDSNGFAALPRAELEALRKEARMPAPARTGDPAPAPAPTPAPAPGVTTVLGFPAQLRALQKRDLGLAGDFCYYLVGLERLYERALAEAEREADGSAVPADLRAWVDEGNRLLVKMIGEETQEQIEGTQDEGASYYWSASTLESALARALSKFGLAREGKRLSAETERCLRAVHKHTGAAHDQLTTLLDGADDGDGNDNEDPEADPDDPDAESRALRERKAKALALKAAVGRVANSE